MIRAEVRHNIGAVRKRLSERKKIIEQSIEFNVFNAPSYAEPLQRIAKEVIESILRDSMIQSRMEAVAVQALLATFVLAQTSSMSMTFSLGGRDGMDSLGNIGDAMRRIPSEAVVQWVTQFKDLDERDMSADGDYLKYETIAERVIGAIWADPYPWFRTDAEGKGALNPDGLVAQLGLLPLSGVRIEAALNAVLDAWQAYFAVEIPMRIAYALDA